MRCNSYDMFFQNFANKTKLDIILLLKQEALSATTIAKRIRQEQSTISHNLKKLTQCHILNVEQKGKERIYSLNKETVVPLLELVKKHVSINCPRGCSR